MSAYQDSGERSEAVETAVFENHELLDDLNSAIQYLTSHAGYIPQEQWAGLMALAGKYAPEVALPATRSVYGADFSLADELEAQILAVRAVRNKIMTADGTRISSDISTREAKEVISSGSTLLATLMKYHERVVNMERMRLLEASVVEALGEVDEELKEQTLHLMEEKLANLA